MFFAWETMAKKIMTGTLIVLMGVTLSSCLSGLFNQPPKAVLTIVQGTPYAPAPQTFVFDISGSYDPDGEIVSFSLGFGDGSALLEGEDLSEPISHLYKEEGMYTVTLEVTDDKGKSDAVNLMFGLSAPQSD